MTGFSRVRGTGGAVDAIVSLKSVNHRGLDLHFHMPPALDPFEPVARAAIKNQIARGHIQIHVSLERNPSPRHAAPPSAGALNTALLDRWLEAFQEISRRLNSADPPNPNTVARIPGMLNGESAFEWTPEMETALTGAFHQALEELQSFRAREGAAIAAEMRDRAGAIGELAARMEAIRSTATAAFHSRLGAKLAELLATAIDPQRLAQEAALLTERSDIAEEITRLKTHAAQLLAQLEAPGEIGKKLDFLLQEMNRETNTILSKTGGLGDHGLTLTGLGLAAKAEIEKMREQSLNLE